MASAPTRPIPAAVARLYEAKGRPSFNPLIAHVGDLAAARNIAHFDAPGDAAGRGVLAGPADAGAAESRRLRGGRSRHRRARHRRDPGPRPPGRARPPARVRPAGGGAVGEPVGPRLADHSGACAERSRRPHRPDRRWRRGRGRRRIHHRRMLRDRRCCCVPAACRAATSSACSAAPWPGRPRMAGRGTAHPLAPGMLASHYAPRTPVRLEAGQLEAGEALLAFGPGAVPGAEPRRRRAEFVRSGAIWRRPPPIFSAIFAPSTAAARAPSR